MCLEPGKAFDRLRMKDGESPTKVEKSIQKTEQPSQQQ